MNTFEEVLARDGKLVYKTKGRSMLPLLRQDKDLVIIEAPSSRLRALDVALYKRGSNYILHRVIRVEDGYYLIRGDNTYLLESVPDTAVIGILTGFRRNGKQVSVSNCLYRLYSRIASSSSRSVSSVFVSARQRCGLPAGLVFCQ